MSDEEKKAIEYYQNNEYAFGFETDMDAETFKKAFGIEETDEDTFEKHQIRFKTLLNLIEKLQKELEEKDKTIKMLDDAYSGAIIESKKWFDIAHNSISKDKIRAKIEELNKTIYNGKIPEFYAIYRYTADVLEKLLEE